MRQHAILAIELLIKLIFFIGHRQSQFFRQSAHFVRRVLRLRPRTKRSNWLRRIIFWRVSFVSRLFFARVHIFVIDGDMSHRLELKIIRLDAHILFLLLQVSCYPIVILRDCFSHHSLAWAFWFIGILLLIYYIGWVKMAFFRETEGLMVLDLVGAARRRAIFVRCPG